MQQRLFLFDLDGTLVDSAPDLGGAVNEMRQARGLSPLPAETLRAPSGHGGPALLKVAFGLERTASNFEAMRLEFLARYAARATLASTLFAGIPEMLERLKSMGYTLGVVTNKPQKLANEVCSHFHLESQMKIVLGLGPEGTALKPRPDSLLTALRTLNFTPRNAFYAGDSNFDGVAAHAVPMRAAWVSWGCQETLPPAGTFDAIANQPSDLVRWVEACR